MSNLPKEAWGAIASIIAAIIAVISAIYNAIQKSHADQKLEAYKLEMNKQLADYGAGIAERNSLASARREYEFEARKRLYNECEPLFFKFADNASNAYYRIQSLARGSREQTLLTPNFLGSYDYYFKSTIYKLIAPLAIYRLMQDKLTLVDLKLDDNIKLQYLVIKQLYLAWTDDFVFARLANLDYDPNNPNWRSLRLDNAGKYWRQGLPMGLLDIVIELLLTKEGEHTRLMSYGEFEIRASTDDYSQKQLMLFKDVFTDFTPGRRPVLWQMLITQAMLYRGLINIQSSDGVEFDSKGEWYNRIFAITEDEIGKFKIVAKDDFEFQNHITNMLEVSKKYIMTTVNPGKMGIRDR